MNKTDKIIVALLFAALLGLTFMQHRAAGRRAAEAAARQAELAREQAAEQQGQAAADVSAAAGDSSDSAAPGDSLGAATSAPEPVPAIPDFEEETVTLRSPELEIEISNRGGSIVRAVLPQYKEFNETNSPPVSMDFAESPALSLAGIPGLDGNSRFEIEAGEGGTGAVIRATAANGLVFEREIALLPRCEIAVRDTFRNTGSASALVSSNSVSLGVIKRGTSRNDTLGVDARPVGGKAVHWDTQLFKAFGASMGCGGAPDASAMPPSASSDVFGAQEWLAIKSRFFVSLYSSDQQMSGYSFSVARDTAKQRLTLDAVTARVRYEPAEVAPGAEFTRSSRLYFGPKRLSYLWAQGEHRYQVMQFGWLTWLCLVLVPLLNALAVVGGGNYGVAIILVTIIIRVLLWPLTHKGAEGARRMQAIQPKLKELQAKFKDDPQKLQQETMILYRENHVNPMSSCLPLLLQMPILIAMYTVLRNATELRFAHFLWIADLSEAENLFEGMLPAPIYSLNILPIVMAATMVIQSRLTPNMGGDQSQQKMMMWMMPVMMLFMFYPLSSGLVLYWTVSNILAIFQTWRQRRSAELSVPASEAVVDASDPGLTRQQRRRMSR